MLAEHNADAKSRWAGFHCIEYQRTHPEKGGIVQLLLKHSADMDAKDKEDIVTTPSHLAKGKAEVAPLSTTSTNSGIFVRAIG
jgi:hypothetical protein